MNGNRFDNLARNVGNLSSRRNMIKAAAGSTLAVLGSGVDHIYPPEHRRLAQEIVASLTKGRDHGGA